MSALPDYLVNNEKPQRKTDLFNPFFVEGFMLLGTKKKTQDIYQTNDTEKPFLYYNYNIN